MNVHDELFIPDLSGIDSPRQVLSLKCDGLNFEKRPSLSFDFTGGACSTNNNRIMMCFSTQENQRCYKSRSPVQEHWWEFTLTKKSIYEHNFTAIALSSYTTSGTFFVRILH